jgi:hypothetical protein
MDDGLGINTARCPNCCVVFEIRHGNEEKAGIIEIKENKPN